MAHDGRGQVVLSCYNPPNPPTQINNPVIAISPMQHAWTGEVDERLGLKDQRTIINTLWRVRRKSYYIGMNLGVEVGTLEVSEGALDRGKALTDVISTWLKTVSPRPTWEALIDALRMPSVGEGVLANEIAEKYCRREWKSDRGSYIIISYLAAQISTDNQTLASYPGVQRPVWAWC